LVCAAYGPTSRKKLSHKMLTKHIFMRLIDWDL
jgi:hypothetical protein